VTESSLFGVSIRGWLALITVVSGLGFLYLSAFLLANDENQILTVIIAAVVGFINLALGFYLGQKSTEPGPPKP
jgi:uncharacterized membrane-anchored protein